MTDLTTRTPRTVDYSSTEAKRRLARRYRAEARFRAYGIIALVLTALFIALLILDVAVKGLPAFWQHSLRLDITLDGAALDPEAARDPARLARADFNRPVRDAFQALFPQVRARAERRLLWSLLSSGAADELRSRVFSDPSLLGRRLSVRALLSDDADLYFKGSGTRIVERAPQGSAALRPAAEGEGMELLSTAADFAPLLDEVKQLRERVSVLERITVEKENSLERQIEELRDR